MEERNRFVDLHVHTNYSDGIFAPGKVVGLAKERGLTGFAVTDHDTVRGVEEALSAGVNLGVEVIPGVEISANYLKSPEKEVHILGYFVDWKDEKFVATLERFRQVRYERAKSIVSKLNGLSIMISFEDVIKNAGNMNSVGRLHIARALIEKGVVHNVGEAFARYLAPDKPGYVPKDMLSPREAIELILNSKGIPVLAHPQYGASDNESIAEFVGYGLKGIEVWHTKHTKRMIMYFLDLVKKFGLTPTGGSDCHGGIDHHGPVIGNLKIPYEVLEALKEVR
ncbi:MAG: PHP domain-containing protein [Elusimicrobiota bacterium]